MQRAHIGFSLVEVLVALALTSILLVVSAKVLIPGLQIWKQTQAVSELEQNAMLGELALEMALLGTTSDSIASLDRPDLQAISFLDHKGSESLAGYDPVEGRTVWRSMTIFKLTPNIRQLNRLEWTGPRLPSSDVFRFTQAELDLACISGLPEKKVATKIRSMRIRQVVDQHDWLVELDFETDTPRGTQTVARGFTVTPRIYGEAP